MSTNNYVRGKKGHCEYTISSSNTEEKIQQFQFQLNLGSENDLKYIERQYRDILEEIGEKKYDEESKQQCIQMYTMIAETRDIHHGKGLRTISYMMIKWWYEYFYFGAKEMLTAFVYNTHSDCQRPYGSWKDMKYFCDYCLKNGWDDNHELIVYVVEMMNDQVKKDWESMSSSPSSSPSPSLSFVSKWIPREKSRMAWLHKKLVENYFPNYFSQITTENKERAWNKAATEYRKIIACLNRALDTVQIKQCANQWSDIDFSKVSKTTLLLEKNAFLNVKKNGEPRSLSNDRIHCSEHIKEYIEEEKAKENTVQVGQLVKDAIELLNEKEKIAPALYECKKKLINKIWKDNQMTSYTEKKRIAMIDFSHSMSEHSLHTAIGLACRIAEDSFQGVLTFSGYSTWICLEDCDTFVDCVEKIRKEQCIPDINTNFYSGLSFVMETIHESLLKDAEIKNVTLVVLSDMQMDYETKRKPLYETIVETYGDRVMPDICFWNVQMTNTHTHSLPFDPTIHKANLLSGSNPKSMDVCKTYGSLETFIHSQFSNLS
jgi:hypothetical protein